MEEEEAYLQTGFDCVVVLDGLPITPKYDKLLLVMTGILSRSGPISLFEIPVDESGITKG